MAAAAHALQEMVAVRYGVVVECRCGWVHHAKDPADHRKAAREALAAHKAEQKSR